jgi:multiple sugar transport system substrate-binding protein
MAPEHENSRRAGHCIGSVLTRRGLLRGIGAVSTVAISAVTLAACGGAGTAAATTSSVASAVSAGATTATTAAPAAATTTSSHATVQAATSSAGTTSSAAQTSAIATAARTTATAATSVSRRAGTVIAWMPLDAFSLTTGIGAELMKPFLAENPGLTLDALVEGDMDKFKTQVAGGTPPDFNMTQSYQQITWGLTGVVEALDSYIAKSKNVKPDDIWKYKWDEIVWKGKAYALPYGNTSWVIWGNQDIYQRAGLDPTKPPATWSDMETTVSKTTMLGSDKQLQQLGFDPFGGSGGRNLWLVPFWQSGGNFTSSDGTKVTIATDPGVTSLEWVAKLYDLQGGYDATAQFTKAAGKGNGVQLFVDNHASSVYATTATKSQYNLANVPQLKYSLAKYPLPPNGQDATYAGGYGICIGTGAKNADGAWALMDYLFQPDVQLKWNVAQLRIPSSISVAKQLAATQNDPLLKLAVDSMAGGRFVPSVPGSELILPIYGDAILAVLQKKMTAQAALADAQSRCQLEMDKYLK